MKTDSILSKENFQTGMLKLEAAFMIKSLTKGTLQVYYERVCHADNEMFSNAVNAVLDKEKWFPSIAKLLEYLPPKKYYIGWE